MRLADVEKMHSCGPPGGTVSLIAELKRRNVIRMAGLYLVGAWLVTQVSATLLPVFHSPEWLLRAIVIVLCAGFLPSLIVAWVFELTPDGLRRDADVPIAESIAPQTAGNMERWILLLFALALMVFSFDRFVLAPRREAALVGQTTQQVTKNANDEKSKTSLNSIAVLPFDNMSGNKDNEYFADGIAEELLNQLAQLPGLQVTGRTSSFAFKGHDEDLREIGRKLGVAYVLEGSVRRSKDRVRITAQLIRAESGFHVWSETYDRELTDIFAVQDEISGAITSALKLSLMADGTGLPATPKVAVSAYDEFLKAQSLLALRGVDNLQAARLHFRAALKIEPNYAPALVGLARSNLLIPLYGLLSGARVKELVAEAEQSAQRALAIEPDNAGAHLVLGTLRSNYQWRWQDAGHEIERALQLAPGSAEVANFAGDYYRILLDRPRAMAMEQRAFELDPLAPFNTLDLGWVNLDFGDCAQAIKHANDALQMSPDFDSAYQILVYCYGELKRFPELNQTIANARARTHAPEPMQLMLEASVAISEARRVDALQILAKLEPYAQAGETSSALLGYNYLQLGESQRAQRWLERAYEQRDPQLVSEDGFRLALIAGDPLTRGILDRPGLKELVEIRKRNGMFRVP